MKKIFFICFSFITAIGYCQEIDTLYYDSNWKGVSNKMFADTFVITLSDEYSNMFRAFTIDNKPSARGSYISINKQDFNESILDGECTTYYPNGKIKSVVNYTNGIRNGEEINYFENGNIQSAGLFKDGEITSIQVYLENGQINKEMGINQGQIHGEYKEYYENGVLGILKTYNNGQENGPVKYYNSDGSIAYSSNMKNNTIDGEEVYYQNGLPIVISNYDEGLPIGVHEDRRNGVSKEIFKEIKLTGLGNLRLSCQVYEAAIPIKETGKLMAMMYGTQTGEKYKSFLNFVLHLKNNSDNNIRASIDDVKVEYITKNKASKNLAFSETDAIEMFKTAAQHSVNKAYNDASYVANAAATQTTNSTSYNSSYNSTTINSKTDSKSSNLAAAIGSTIAGVFGVNSSGEGAIATGASVSGAVGASTSNSTTSTSGTIKTSSSSSNSNTISHTDGYIQYQIYNEEAKKAEQKASNAAIELVERTEKARYSNIQLAPNSLSQRWIVADMQNKYDTVKLSFSINGTPCEIEFTLSEVNGVF